MTKPVSDFENDSVGGHALCHKDLLDQHTARTKELRERHAAYLATLPTDPIAALQEATRVLCPDSEDYPHGFTRARHLSAALIALVRHGDFDGDDIDRQAAAFIAETITYDLLEVSRQLDRVNDLIRAPKVATIGQSFEA